MKTQRRQSKGSKAENVQNVPADIMRPRLLFLLTVFVLTLFGLVMVYSSSSVLALGSELYGNNPYFFIKKQVISLAIAIGICAVVSSLSYRNIGLGFIYPMGIAINLVLLYTVFSGINMLGASRWISIPGIGQLQPSEFAKPYIILAGAFIINEILETGSDPIRYLKEFAICVLLPSFLILIQPDKGTFIVISVTLFYMLCMAGFFDKQTTVKIILFAFILAILLGIASYVKGGYGAIRIKAFLNPWEYKDDEAYQIVQGYYAFASGGIFGKGVGFSSQKYDYLPMAYNDFIYAIVGEELGLIGTLGVLFAFFFFYKVSGEIAQKSSDTYGSLIVSGASVMIVSQFLLNVVGVIGLFPSSGKPIPFISYGGSSIMGTYILVGMILNVSRGSKPRETRYDRRRSKLSVVGGSEAPQTHNGFKVIEGAGEPTPRKKRGLGSNNDSKSLFASRNKQKPTARTSSRKRGSSMAQSSRSQRKGRR